MKNNWYYRTQTGDAGLNKKPPRIKDLGDHTVGIFVREVIQNNLDAAEGDKAVVVEFNIREWNKADISQFFSFVGKDHIDLIKKSTLDPDPTVAPHLKNCLEIINGKKNSSFCVSVEESNCIGLLGPVRESKNEKSHFDALMRKIENNEAKKETTNTGGTWGKGSSIFTYTSQLWTWFSYSKLAEPWVDPQTKLVHYKRFMGRSMLAPFFDENENQSILGDGWFCDIEKLKTDKIDAYPFVNEYADTLAQQLGLRVRNDSGTTFFIPFFMPQMENGNKDVTIDELQNEFIEQILKNWFIAIYDGKLIVKVSTVAKSVSINPTYLEGVTQLNYKLQILEWYKNDCPPNDKRFLKEAIEIELPGLKQDFINERTQFAKVRSKAKSDLIIRIINEDEDFLDTWKTCNKVALCRNKGMIINHEELFESKAIRTESIFFGGLKAKLEPSVERKKHFDLFLAYSENPAHNTWCRSANDYDRCFLERFEGKRPKPEASMNQLFNEIIKVFKKLIEIDSEHKENKDICSIFKKLAKLTSKGDNNIGKSLFYMRSISDQIDLDGRYLFTKKIISASKSQIDVYFKSYIDSLEGEKDRDFEFLGIQEFSELEVLDNFGNLISCGINPKISLMPEKETIIVIKTCKIDNNPYFKNVDPFIKTYAKEVINE